MIAMCKQIGWDPRTVLGKHGIVLEQTAPGRHSRRAERCIRTIKERFRCVLLSLPYRLPRKLLSHLVLYCVECYNLMPNVNSGVRSPREIVTGVKPQIPTVMGSRFGDIIIAKTPNTARAPAHLPRADLGIIIGRELHGHKTARVFLLHNGVIVSRSQWEHPTVTTDMINTINAISADDDYDVDDILLPDDVTLSDADGAPTVVSPPSTTRSSSTSSSTTSEPPRSVHSLLPPPPLEQRSTRSNRGLLGGFVARDYAFNLTVKAAIQKHQDAAVSALQSELRQLVDKNVFTPVSPSTLSSDERCNAIPCSVFLKEKFKPDGSFDKLKARLVAGGHRQDRTMYVDVSSPTVDIASVFIGLSIAASRNLRLVVIDITAAFLNAQRRDAPRVIMRLGPDLVRALRAIGRFPDDHLTSLADSRGSILVDVHRALYGLIDSPKLWYEHLISVFKKLGFSVSSHDRGVLYRHTTAGTCYAFIHVDDILLATPSIELEQELVARLNKEFGETSTQYPPRLFYLGMQIDIDPRSHAISITQPGFVASVLTAHPVSRVASSPYTADFLDEDSASPPCDATAFASRLMKLNFLVKRSRPDLGF